MSGSDDVGRNLCPDGVPFKALRDLLDYQQPAKYLVESVNYDDSYATPVLTAGQTFILGYTDETNGIYPASSANPVVIFDDFTTAFKWVDFPFKAKSSAMKMLTPKPGVSLRYVWFAMQTIRYATEEHARQWIGTYSEFKIPVPPVEVQREIVGTLDLFQALEAELVAELAARRRQYVFYRDQLLTFGEASEVRWIPMGEIGTWYGGGTPSKAVNEYWQDGTVPWLSPKDMAVTTIVSTENRVAETALLRGSIKRIPAGSIAIVVRSNILRRKLPTAYVPMSVTLNQDMRAVVPREDVLATYLAQVLQANAHRILRVAGRVAGSMAAIENQALMSYKIPVPSLDEQHRIVEILSKFDELVNDASTGLPAELAARRQQFELYRDRLLTFEEAA